MLADIIERIERTATNVAASSGATASVKFRDDANPVVMNNPQLTQRMLPSLRRVAGDDRVVELPLITGSEDFAHYADLVPGLFFYIGVTPAGKDAIAAPSNHSPLFYIDEPGLALATRTLTAVAIDYLQSAQ
jgi:metal-dependent amidase/aminoacylase/carboxypeptidase family protein